MPSVLKSDSLNLVEPSGPVQACNGIALPFYIQHLQLRAQRKDIRSVLLSGRLTFLQIVKAQHTHEATAMLRT